MTSASTTPRTRARLSAARRAEILDAVIAVVTREGYEQATMESFAEGAGASKATLYRHWRDKPTLVAQAALERSGIRLEAIDTGTLAGDLDAVMDMLALNAAQNFGLMLALSRASHQDEQLRQALHHVTHPALKALDDLARRAAERGETTPERAEFLPHLVIGALVTPALLGSGSPTALTADHLQRYARLVVLPYLRGE